MQIFYIIKISAIAHNIVQKLLFNIIFYNTPDCMFTIVIFFGKLLYIGAVVVGYDFVIYVFLFIKFHRKSYLLSTIFSKKYFCIFYPHQFCYFGINIVYVFDFVFQLQIKSHLIYNLSLYTKSFGRTLLTINIKNYCSCKMFTF